MRFTKHIPNLLTLGNLFCGTIATILAVQGEYVSAAFFVVLGILFDFFDGFVARLLKVSDELGTQLDSLADMVTSGVVPGIVMYNLLYESTFSSLDAELIHKSVLLPISIDDSSMTWVSYLGLILTLAACYRLAKFNIDTRQTDSFIGLPTPAMSLFVISLPLIVEYSNYSLITDLVQSTSFLIIVTLALGYLMNAELPLFSLKFKNYRVKENIQKYSFLLGSVFLIGTLKFVSIPVIIILYILNSIIGNYKKL
jgi:CDP-diacylglycerol--serine O-phosphatidyltransferase